MKRHEVLHEVEKLICKDRQDKHGAPENSFALIASAWTAYLQDAGLLVGVLQPYQVAEMMAELKECRQRINPNNPDNRLDQIGYLAISVELKNATDQPQNMPKGSVVQVRKGVFSTPAILEMGIFLNEQDLQASGAAYSGGAQIGENRYFSPDGKEWVKVVSIKRVSKERIEVETTKIEPKEEMPINAVIQTNVGVFQTPQVNDLGLVNNVEALAGMRGIPSAIAQTGTVAYFSPDGYKWLQIKTMRRMKSGQLEIVTV